MNRSVELLDSTIVEISGDGEKVVTRLESVHVLESDGVPGVDEGLSFIQDLEIRISAPSLRPVINALPARVADGGLKLSGCNHQGIIPLPVIHSGEVEFWCETDSAERFSVQGNAVVLVLMGERRTIEQPGVPDAT